jgi:SOS-response transcriptional repressor LexA
MPKIKYPREDVLTYIIAYKTANDGNSPTIREIMSGCHVSSSSMVSYILRDLQDAGKLRIEQGSRGIMVTGGVWKVEAKNGNG